MTKTPEELTEEWKAGKLECGWYWIKHKTRGTISDQYIPGDDWFVSSGFCITKILAPCNYDEYKAMQAAAQNGESAIDTNKRLCKKIERLRELLKECLPLVSAEIMTWQIRGGEESRKRGQDLLTRINAALGESEE